MARYIDADKLVRVIKLYANRTSLGQICPPDLSYSEILDIIADAPTADVAPRAGDVTDTNVGCKWCKDEDALDNLVCYIPADNGSSIDPPVRYCPFCGRRIFEEDQT